MYTNDKGEEIDFETYTRAKFKQLLGAKEQGTKVLKALVDDKKLTEEERQKVCLALGTAGTQYECNKSKVDPTTLMRSDSGFTYFNAAYLKQYAKGYLDAVLEKNQAAINNLALSEQEMHQGMVNAYSSEISKMSKEAAVFLKANANVVKAAFPEHADQLMARMLVNDLCLRNTSSALTSWSVSLQVKLDQDVKERFHEVKDKIKSVSNRVSDLEGAIGIQEDRNKRFKQEVQDLEGQPFEQRLAQKKLDDGISSLEKLKEEYSQAVKSAKADIEKVTEEGNKILGKDAEQVQPIQRGLTGNVVVLRTLNHTDGFTSREVGEGELDTNGFKGALSKIAKGQVPGQEITQDIKVEAIDIPSIVKEVREEKEIEDLKQEEIKRLKVEEAAKEKIKASKNAYENAKVEAQPELDKIAALEKQLDSLNLAKKQLKTPGATMKVGGKEVEAYKPSAGDKLKAVFTKGGMEGVLEKKLQTLIEKIDKEKMTVQLKTDKNFYKEVMDSHEATSDEMGRQITALKTGVERYEAARQQVMDADRELTIDARKKLLNEPSLPLEEVEKLQALLEEGELAMKRYEADYNQHVFLSEQQQTAKASLSVRESLKKGVEKEMTTAQNLKTGTGEKVTENKQAPKLVKGVK